MWFDRERHALSEADVNKTSERANLIQRRMPSDRWDPVLAGSKGFRYFDKAAAAACVASKRIHIAGDSTSRDTFYEFLAVSGHPIFAERAGNWSSGEYEPRAPFSSMGRDNKGECMGEMTRKKMCVRHESFGSSRDENNTEVSQLIPDEDPSACSVWRLESCMFHGVRC